MQEICLGIGLIATGFILSIVVDLASFAWHIKKETERLVEENKRKGL